MRSGFQKRLLLMWIGCTLNPAAVWAQQTIFNVPSADVTPEGHLYVEHESQFTPWNPGANWLGTHYSALGVGHHTELDVTLYNVSAPDINNIALGVGFKRAQPLLEKRFPKTELKWIVGYELPISLQGQGVGSWGYTEVSARLPKLKTRLTAGVSAGTKQIFGRNTVGFIGGYEQPVTKNFSLIGDWYSGKSSNGFFIPGCSYKLPKNVTVYAGYQLPNAPENGKSGFVIEISKLF